MTFENSWCNILKSSKIFMYECSTSASYLDVLLKLDTNGKFTTQLYDKTGWFSISPLSTFLNYVAIFQFHLHMVFISRSWFGIPLLVRHTISFGFEVVYWHRGFYWLIDYLRFYVPLKNISLIWRRHHCRCNEVFWTGLKIDPGGHFSTLNFETRGVEFRP
jgi:hypothetical protein